MMKSRARAWNTKPLKAPEQWHSEKEAVSKVTVKLVKQVGHKKNDLGIKP